MNPSTLFFAEQLSKTTGLSLDEAQAAIEPTPNPELGDYAFGCFSLAKTLRKLPVQIAEDIVEKLPVGGPIVEATSAGPYVNVRINRKLMTAQVLGDVFSRTTRFGNSNVGKDELVVIDYSSPNVAKRFHVGHLSSTVIGGALANMFECLGYSVLRINHLGDWGTQFGKLIVAFHNWGDDDELKRAPIEHLEQLYVRFHTEAETQPELDDQARDWSRRLEEGDSDARELWQLFRDVSIDELEQIYKRLGVRFDHYHGEAFYEPLLNDTIDAVESSGQLELSDDAMVIKFPESEDMPPMLLRRSDGATLYATRDLAAAYYRWKTFKFTKCLYVVGQDQALHFKQLFTALEQLGCDWVDRVEHVGFGRVKGMSTRKGNVVLIDDLLGRAVGRVEEIMKDNPDQFSGIDDPEAVAEAVGVGAIIFSTVSRRRMKDVEFDWDRALNFQGETGPYLQYTHARMASILRKASEVDPKEMAQLAALRDNDPELISKTVDISLITSDVEWAVIKELDRFESQISSAADQFDPSYVASYLIDLAAAANKFHYECRVINPDEPDLMKARLALSEAIRQVLNNGLALLCLNAPERM